ncbi:hypothetical protein C0J56_18975 [Pseudomonas fluorescens]|nr:hypothetical protein C0J56_18975 [Pseudomonas fluorescens]
MWRGDSSPLGCEAAPKPGNSVRQKIEFAAFRAAAQPSGDKSPRHKKSKLRRLIRCASTGKALSAICAG